MGFWENARRSHAGSVDYFAGCTGKDEIRKRYYELVKKHHPDKGGDTATMQRINAQYEALEAKNYRNAQAEKERKQQAGDTSYTDDRFFDFSQFQTILDGLMQLDDAQLDGITIEVIGAWVWVYGETRPMKEHLKSLGFKWGGKKKAWYWYSPEFAPKGTVHGGLDKLRDIHGSAIFKDKVEHKALT